MVSLSGHYSALLVVFLEMSRGPMMGLGIDVRGRL